VKLLSVLQMKPLFIGILLLILNAAGWAQFLSSQQASSVGQNTATITWQSCAVSDSTVKYGTTTSYGQQATNASLVSSHSVPLSGLTAGTLYHASVVSRDGNSQSVSSPDFTFTTAAAPPPPAGTNIATSGVGYRWHTNSTSTSNANKATAPGLNDGNLTVDVNLDGTAYETSALYEAGGVIWSTAQSVSSVNFTNGTWTQYNDGGFGANLSLQFTTDGVVWTNSGWVVSPAYAYDSSSVSGVTYSFAGSTVSVRGFRIAGQVHTTTTGSYFANIREVQVFASAPPPPTAHFVDLTWTASTTGGVTYNVKRSTISGGSYELVQSGVVTTAYQDTANSGQTLFYVVSASDGTGESVNSNEVSVVIP
jgi:hypothetical protein